MTESIEQTNAPAAEAQWRGPTYDGGIKAGAEPFKIGELWLPRLDLVKAVGTCLANEAELERSKAEVREEVEGLQRETALDDPQGIAILASATTKLSLYEPHQKAAAAKTAAAAEAFRQSASELLVPLVAEVRRKQELLNQKFYDLIAPHMRGLLYDHPEYVDRAAIDRTVKSTFTFNRLSILEQQIRQQLATLARVDANGLEKALSKLLELAKNIEQVSV